MNKKRQQKEKVEVKAGSTRTFKKNGLWSLISNVCHACFFICTCSRKFSCHVVMRRIAQYVNGSTSASNCEKNEEGKYSIAVFLYYYFFFLSLSDRHWIGLGFVKLKYYLSSLKQKTRKWPIIFSHTFDKRRSDVSASLFLQVLGIDPVVEHAKRKTLKNSATLVTIL